MRLLGKRLETRLGEGVSERGWVGVQVVQVVQVVVMVVVGHRYRCRHTTPIHSGPHPHSQTPAHNTFATWTPAHSLLQCPYGCTVYI